MFRKPVDRIGDKSLPDYAQYAGQPHLQRQPFPGARAGRLFVGQRREGFVVNLAEAFDLINLNPLGAVDGDENVLADKNVTSLVLEVPTACVTRGSDPVIGAWTTASERRDEGNDKDDDDDDEGDFDRWANGHDNGNARGRYKQVSRLGMPLVNEVVIGIKDKNKFNASEPKDDAQFGTYVTNPTLPVLIQVLFGVPAPATPRNGPRAGVPDGRARPEPARQRAPGGDAAAEHVHRARAARGPEPVRRARRRPAGFPNGRRPGDDVVDIALRAVEGVLLPGHRRPWRA